MGCRIQKNDDIFYLVWDNERGTFCVIPEGLEADSFPVKYNHTSSDYKVHSVEIDLYYFKCL